LVMGNQKGGIKMTNRPDFESLEVY